ncbi:MAG: hypothetical protein LAP61_05760 [Acidobacteriia bacterium]|nr:hypothetical protein [Terriglobia bacterium]
MSWQEIGTAPKGMTKTIKSGKDSTREAHVPQWVFVWKPGMEPTLSRYLPEQDRWSGFTKDAPPTLWHPQPSKPSEAV